MTRRIDEDRKEFHEVYAGRKRKELQKRINNGTIFRNRGKNGKIPVTIPKINIPHLTFGLPNDGVGRGPGDKGDVVHKDDPQGKGKSSAGEGEGEGIEIQVDLEEVLKFMQDELQLPDLKPKPNETYEEVKKKYNNISLTGPESLRHNRRTLKEALKRQCADGSINKLHKIPGFNQPVRLITPINSDKRYRQYNEIKIPSSNAVVFFARDGSGSMDQKRCDVVSDMCWWIDAWIRRFYDRVERCYIWHDYVAQEVDEKKFYKYRHGGGTRCSSALKLISEQFENRFPPSKWNIYVFYFTDGDNWGDDNNTFCKLLQESFNPRDVNMFGLTQVMPWDATGLKEYVDKVVKQDNLRTTVVDPSVNSDEERDVRIRKAIIDLIGKGKESSR